MDQLTNKCVLSKVNLQGPSDKGCARWNWDAQVCLECAPKWRFDNSGKCIEVDLNCQQFNTQTQACLACYKGYILNSTTNVCILNPVNINGPVDLGCKSWNWDLQVCL